MGTSWDCFCGCGAGLFEVEGGAAEEAEEGAFVGGCHGLVVGFGDLYVYLIGALMFRGILNWLRLGMRWVRRELGVCNILRRWKPACALRDVSR